MVWRGLLAVCFAGSLYGQVGTVPPYPQNFDALKAALRLTDTQVRQLRDLRQSRAAAAQAVQTQIAAKQQQMNVLLAAGSTDALIIGQLQIDISKLRDQLVVQGEGGEDAVHLLDESQKLQLKKLEEALQLQRAVNEAQSLGLLSHPPAPKPVPVPVLLGPAKKETVNK